MLTTVKQLLFNFFAKFVRHISFVNIFIASITLKSGEILITLQYLPYQWMYCPPLFFKCLSVLNSYLHVKGQSAFLVVFICIMQATSIHQCNLHFVFLLKKRCASKLIPSCPRNTYATCIRFNINRTVHWYKKVWLPIQCDNIKLSKSVLPHRRTDRQTDTRQSDQYKSLC